MDATELEALRKAGANARALGFSEFDNPFYVKSMMPAETGEPIEEWVERTQAWSDGWKVEDAIRG